MSGAVEQIHTITQMEKATSTEGVFELPCGYIDPDTNELHTQIEVHEITGHEEDMLASRQIQSMAKLTLLLSGCLKRVGSITDPHKIARIVKELTSGDRVFTLFAIRRVTLGDEFPVREICPRCGVKGLFMINLAEDMEIRPMADPMKRVYDVGLPSGKTVRFRVSSGHDEERTAKIRRSGKDADAISQALLMRIELLEGEQPTLEVVKSLGMRDRRYLNQQYQKVEGGVDTKLELQCAACDHEWEKDLDVAASGFFSLGETQEP